MKVSGEATGAPIAPNRSDDETKAIAVWRNDTAVVFQPREPDSVQRFYQQFRCDTAYGWLCDPRFMHDSRKIQPWTMWTAFA